ncbi:MAG: UPF0164 family protein [Bacteroidales bacterium]|nr:UPF0164 family protein [Bacteroidales bacterium]
MKKFSLIFLVLISMLTGIKAQNVDDALRYSQLFYNGTARFNSMGGAFTALGGDISSLSQNPAGTGVFRSSEFTITPQLFHIKTTAGLFAENSVDYLYDFNLAQAGIVVNLLKKEEKTGLITLNFGYSFNRTNNFTQSIVMQGTSDKSSLLDYWAEKTNGWYKDELENNDAVYDSYLGWRTYLIDSLPGSNTKYGTIYSNYGDEAISEYGQNMKRVMTTSGFSGEHSFSIGGNYSNKLFFGATLGISRINFESTIKHSESADKIMPSRYSPAGDGFTDFNYTYYYKNIGTGYSLKIGGIYRPLDILKIGVAFHSPTLFKIDEYNNDNLSTWFTDLADPINVDNEPMRFNYALATPFRAIAGAALQIKKIALISADYEFIDYSTAKFSETGDDYDYGVKNQEIRNTLRPVSNIRLGAEVRLNSIYLRGGYGFYGRPWTSGDINEELNYNSIALGIGFREQNIFVDFGFSRMTNNQNYILYSVDDIEEVMTNLNIHRNIFTLTFGYKFGY